MNFARRISLGVALAFFLNGISAFWLPQAQARVFSYQNESLAVYLRGSGGLSTLGADAYAHSSGAATRFSSDESQYTMGGELGLAFSFGSVNMRIGVEALRPQSNTVDGTNAGGTTLFTLDSQIFVFHPNVMFEYVYSAVGSTRFYGLLGGGMAQVTLDNQYQLTAAGLTAFSPVTNYTEKAEVWAYTVSAGMGFETHFTDNVTFGLDFFYRYFPVTDLKHKAAVQTIAQGSVAKGAKLRNQNGDLREFDLGGIVAAATFRFYLDF